MRVGFSRLRRRRVAPGADRPDGLVGNHQLTDLLRRQVIQALLDLTVEHLERLVALALVQRLADAGDRRQAGGKRRVHLPVHHRIGLAEQRPPLGVADDDVLGAGFADHRTADLAGERPLALPVKILRGNAARCCCARLRTPRAPR